MLYCLSTNRLGNASKYVSISSGTMVVWPAVIVPGVVVAAAHRLHCRPGGHLQVPVVPRSPRVGHMRVTRLTGEFGVAPFQGDAAALVVQAARGDIGDLPAEFVSHAEGA